MVAGVDRGLQRLGMLLVREFARFHRVGGRSNYVSQICRAASPLLLRDDYQLPATRKLFICKAFLSHLQRQKMQERCTTRDSRVTIRAPV